MANEITITASISVNKPSIMSSALSKAISALLRTMTGNFYIADTMSVTTVALAVPLGSVTSPRWAFFSNLDATNYITLFNGSTGAVFARLLAGDPALVPLDPTCVPFAQANSAPCLMEYAIFST